MTGFFNWLFHIAPPIKPYRPAIVENDNERALDKAVHEAVARHEYAAMGVIRPSLDGMEEAVQMRRDLSRVLQRIEYAERNKNVQRH